MNPTDIFLTHIRTLIGENDLPTAVKLLQQFLKGSPKLDNANV